MAKSMFSREVALTLEGEINAFQVCRSLSQRARDINTERKLREAEDEIPEEELPNSSASAMLDFAEGRIALVTGESADSRVNQKRIIPEQTIQKTNEYQQKSMARKRFSDLSEKAMNPDVRAHFSLPELNEDDIQLVGKWCNTPMNNLNRMSLVELMKTDSKTAGHLGRLLSARFAEKTAMYFYQNQDKTKTVEDISITQIDENNNSDWRDYDLKVDGYPIDVKNSRRSQKSKDRYTEHCVPQFKCSRENKNVKISGVFSPYIRTPELLEPTEHHENAEILFLGETDIEEQQKLKQEFKDLVGFERPNNPSKYFLPPWVFDYPEYVYKVRDNALKELKGFSDLALLKDELNLIPVAIAAGIDLTKILDKEALDHWEWCFLDQLRNRIERRGLSLPFLFLSILEHFLDMAMAASPKIVSDFKPEKYREFLFCKEPDKPLGIYDPLKTIDALINVLSILWTAEDGLIRKFRVFKLISFNILQGKSNPNDSSWTTLIAYCGGWLNKARCGKNSLVLGEGESELCERCSKLICPDCGFCCEKCREERSPTSSSHTPTEGFKPAGPSVGTSETGESDFAI